MNKNASTTMQTASVAKQGAHGAPEEATSTKGATSTNGAPGRKTVAKKGRETSSTTATVAARVSPPATKKSHLKATNAAAKSSAQKVTGTATVPREFSKKAIVLDLLRRKSGATMSEIMKQTGWQAHSVRGFVSGQLAKRMGLKIESTRNEANERVYKIAK